MPQRFTREQAIAVANKSYRLKNTKNLTKQKYRQIGKYKIK